MTYQLQTIDGEIKLREKNPIPTDVTDNHYLEHEARALSEAKVLINPEALPAGVTEFDEGEFKPIQQVWSHCQGWFDYFKLMGSLKGYSKTRIALKYIAPSPEKEWGKELTNIYNAKIDGYTDGYGDGTEHERTRILAIIEGRIKELVIQAGNMELPLENRLIALTRSNELNHIKELIK